MNAHQQGRACRKAWERQSTQSKQWCALDSPVAEIIFQRWTQQCLIPHAFLQCDLATPHQEVESIALTLQSRLVLMTSLTNQMCCNWQDILGLQRWGHKKHFSFCLCLLGHSLLKYSIWEAQATQRSHVWGLQLASPVELQVNSQHQLPTLWMRHLEPSAYSKSSEH